MNFVAIMHHAIDVLFGLRADFLASVETAAATVG